MKDEISVAFASVLPSLLALFALFASGCGGAGRDRNPASVTRGGLGEDPPAPLGSPRLLALGDSYSIGEGVSQAERWPVQLVAALRARGIDMADPTIIARTGWTTDDLATALDAARPSKPYALVFLLIGVNDQYRGGNADSYRRPFAALLDRAIDLAGGRAERVVVLSIPDWGVTPFATGHDRGAIAAAVDQFNVMNRAEALRAGARYVEITAASRRARETPRLIAADGLHPSGEMYAEWVEAVLPVALVALGEREQAGPQGKSRD